MTPTRHNDAEAQRFHLLMTGALDNELSDEEEREFTAMINANPAYAREWQEFQQIKEMTMQMKFSSPPEEVWDRYWVNVYNRVERRIGWLLVSVGAVVVLVYSAYLALETLLADQQVTWFMKGAILLIAAGAIILFVSVLREKLHTHRSERYKEIRR